MANGEEKKIQPVPDEPKPVNPAADSAMRPLPSEAETAPHATLDSEPAEPTLAQSPKPMQPAQSKPAPAARPEPIRQPMPAEIVVPEKKSDLVRAAYEHPLAIRITHWVNAVSLFVLVASGLRIFRAFPSFGPKIPQQDLIDIPKALTLGGWLGGALQWHFTFMWIFAASGVLYLTYQLLSGHYRTVLFTPKDIPGVWPMVRHYFLFGPKPPITEQYNPLQKLAYTSTVGFGTLSLLTGIVLYKPVQFSWLAFLFGGFHLMRVWHFAAMCGFLAFIPGHLIMVALHGWSNFFSMLSGWKREPEYQE